MTNWLQKDLAAERVNKSPARASVVLGDRNFFQFRTDKLVLEQIGNHTGVYSRALRVFMNSEPELFYNRFADEAAARKALRQAEDTFVQYFQEFKKDMLSINDVVKHAKKFTDEEGWAHTYCGRFTHPQAVDRLVFSATKFQKVDRVNKCPVCIRKLEAEASQSKN